MSGHGQRVRELLSQHNLRAKKSWGQNFLVDDRVYDAIIASCRLGPGDVVVEIGAGLGTLTAALLSTGAEVVAIERERDMCLVLAGQFTDEPRLTLREDNAMLVALSEFAPSVTVVGNLPYQIATPLLFRVLAQRDVVRQMVLMFQLEVAERLLAQPDTDDWSALSAQVQLLCEVQRVCKAGRGAFLPQPRVDSMVVRLVPRPAPLHPVDDLGRYAQVVRAAFGQRRKTLRNAISAVFGEQTEAALLRAQIDPQRRGESLTLLELTRLSNQLGPPQSAEPAQGEAGDDDRGDAEDRILGERAVGAQGDGEATWGEQGGAPGLGERSEGEHA